MATLAVVPARGGSVGLPGKNLARFRGRPLVAHTVWTARLAGLGDVVVTTDDPAIESVSADAGAKVVRRPPELSTATSRTLPAVLHTLDTLGVADGTLVVLLQPTSPLRTAEDITECLRLHGDRPSGSVVQMTRAAEHHPLKACLDTGSGVVPVRDWTDLEAPRQELPPVVRPTGGVYVVRAADLRRHQRFFVPEVLAQYIPPERAIDIDTEDDLRRAEAFPGQTTS